MGYVWNRLLSITCAVCNKEVDSVEAERNPKNNTIKYTVHCHGETDTCELDQGTMAEIDPRHITEGVAFTNKCIEGPNLTATEIEERFKKLAGK